MTQAISADSLIGTHQGNDKLIWLGGRRTSSIKIPRKLLRQGFSSIAGLLNNTQSFPVSIAGKRQAAFLHAPASHVEIRASRPACLIVTDKVECPAPLLAQDDFPVFRWPSGAGLLLDSIWSNLPYVLAKPQLMHGVFLSVFGKGILLTGKEGSGKSALALQLLQRGHALIADDQCEFFTLADGRIIGRSPETITGQLHVRHLGFIDVAAHFGAHLLRREHTLDALVNLASVQKTSTASDFSTLIAPQWANFCHHVLPQWSLPIQMNAESTTFVETCARQLYHSRPESVPLEQNVAVAVNNKTEVAH